MVSYGRVTLKDTNPKRYDFVWVENEAGFERIDVLNSIEDFVIYETSKAVAAYYRKQQPKVLGDFTIIQRMFETKSMASVFKAEQTQTVNVEDGKVVIVISKEDKRLGVKSVITMENGYIEKMYYETDDAILDISAVDNTRFMDTPVLNLSEYKNFSLFDSKVSSATQTSDYYSLDYLKAKYPLEHMENYDFVVVDSMETAVARLERWAKADTKVKAIDLETTGLQWSMLGEDVITGVVLSYSETESTYYPFRQENFDYNLPISFLQTILDTIDAQPKDVKIIGHNAKVEIQGVWKEDVHYIKNSEFARRWDPEWEEHALHNPQLRIDGDSFILSILVNPVFQKGMHSLKSLAYKIRKLVFLELEDVFVNKNEIKFNVLPPEIVKYYACPDTANTIAVWNYLITKLPKAEMGILGLESKLLYVTAENEFYGMRTRRDVLVDALENENYKVKILGDWFRSIHKTSKNINSNQVRQDIFYNKLRCPIEVRTNKGAPSTSNIALKRIVELGTLRDYDKSKIPPPIVDLNGVPIVKGEQLVSNKYPSLVILESYSKATKELGALKRIERKSLKDRVMFNINQAGAASGRRTSDAHQYSDGMKKLIVADTNEYRLWSCDFKQVELRILAYLAGQKDLIKLESDPDVDVHRAILSIITGKPIWAISAAERKKGKSTNFGVVYMMSAYGLAKKNAGPAYTKEDLVQAMQAINGFYNGLPNIKAFVAHNEEFVKQKGYMRTKFGRFRYFKEILEPDVSNSKVASIVRAANNTPVQGFGADLLKICECDMKDYIKKKGWDQKIESEGLWLPRVRMMLSIHDEVLVSSHKSIPVEEIITMFKICMEQQIDGAPPFFAAPAMVNSWYDGKLDQFELDLSYRDEIVNAWADGHKRLLHADTYCDEFDYKQVDEINEYCRCIRKQCLGEDKSEEDAVEYAGSLIDKQNMQRLRKHFISPDEHFKPEEVDNIVIRRVLDSEYSHYLEDLTRYRTQRLRAYMDELIAKYKTVDEVAAHVQHPELTHTLISVEIGKKEKFEHMEAIHEAVKRYMDSVDVESIIVREASSIDRVEKGDYLENIEQLEEYVEFDMNGEAVVEEVDESEEDDIFTIKNTSAVTVGKPEREYATFMMSDVIVDLSDYKIGDERAEEVNQTLAKISGKDKPYRVVYFIQDRLVPSKLKIDYAPDEINEIVRACS